LINVIESDIGLTAAILRRSQCAGGKSVTNVLDAVSELTMREILDSINELPVASFPWQTAVERMLHHSRVHAQAVARAADRIGREALVSCTDDVVAVALLHDVGKLAIARALPGYEDATDARSLTAEIRVRRERQALGLDHASLGGLLLERWGLPSRISAVVAAHHTSAEEGEFATIVRLADLVARHAQGDAVDRRQLLRLAAACGLSARMLRDVLFDLPRSGGSQRRRAQPSPLSSRETAVLRLLADGDLYKEIALKLGLSQSTVRTHLHHVYRKLEVADRAQAVLRATEMGWL
jgi:DNA-binding CsgD family transcriptional regulator/HD-like signal output (HDOD) protein